MGKDELGHDCGALQPTDDGYFTFTLLSDGTYEIKARDRKNIPAKVVLPSTYNGIPVTSIGEGAFVRYSSLTSINIPDSVTSIRNYAFSFCSRLTSIVIPDSVTSIGDEAFSDCYSLTSINVSANNMNYKSIDGNLYSKDGKTLIQYAIGKTATAFTIPDSVTSIGDWAFGGCSGLTSVTIGNSVTSIGYGAFYGCSSLTSITIPDSVTSIGDGAFYGCSSLMSINVSANNTNYKSIDGNLYSKDGKTLIQYAIGKTATTFTIPDSVSSIGGGAFSDCYSLTSITIGNSVSSIGGGAFSDCYSLTSIDIPDSVTSIGEDAFSFCSRLTSITFNGTMAQWGAIEKDSDWKGFASVTVVKCTDGDVAI